MIQSYKSDSYKMEISNYFKKTFDFIYKRLIELIAILLGIVAIFLIISLISYSTEDPNFIFPDNTKMENLLGYRGSYLSDILLQSVGLISFLIPVTFFLHV